MRAFPASGDDSALGCCCGVEVCGLAETSFLQSMRCASDIPRVVDVILVCASTALDAVGAA